MTSQSSNTQRKAQTWARPERVGSSQSEPLAFVPTDVTVEAAERTVRNRSTTRPAANPALHRPQSWPTRRLHHQHPCGSAAAHRKLGLRLDPAQRMATRTHPSTGHTTANRLPSTPHHGADHVPPDHLRLRTHARGSQGPQRTLRGPERPRFAAWFVEALIDCSRPDPATIPFGSARAMDCTDQPTWAALRDITTDTKSSRPKHKPTFVVADPDAGFGHRPSRNGIPSGSYAGRDLHPEHTNLQLQRNLAPQTRFTCDLAYVPSAGIEPAPSPPEGDALSPELRGREDHDASAIRRARRNSLSPVVPSTVLMGGAVPNLGPWGTQLGRNGAASSLELAGWVPTPAQLGAVARQVGPTRRLAGCDTGPLEPPRGRVKNGSSGLQKAHVGGSSVP